MFSDRKSLKKLAKIKVKYALRHMAVKLKTIRDKEKILRATREKKLAN